MDGGLLKGTWALDDWCVLKTRCKLFIYKGSGLLWSVFNLLAIVLLIKNNLEHKISSIYLITGCNSTTC